MASAFKPKYTRPIPEGAKIRKLKGQDVVEYTDDRGKKHQRPLKVLSSGKKLMVCEQRRWWMDYVLPSGERRREKGYTDKQATEQEAAKREAEAARMDSGMIRVSSEQLRRPIMEHVDEYIEDRVRIGRDAMTNSIVRARLRATVQYTGWNTLSAVRPKDMTDFLRHLKSAGRVARTTNDYLVMIKTFLKWCVNQRRLDTNPLDGVRPARVVAIRERRAYAEDEVRRMLEVAGNATLHGTGGPWRRLVYLVAVTTGLRKKEIAELQWRDIDLDFPGGARLCLRAEATKSRRADTLPLRQDVADELRAYRPPDAKPHGCPFPRRINIATFRADQKRAGIKHVDEAGRVADFHSLRKTFGTMLAKAGVHPRVVMKLMRHTDVNITMKLYTDVTLMDPQGAVERLPQYGGEPAEKPSLDKPAPPAVLRVLTRKRA